MRSIALAATLADAVTPAGALAFAPSTEPSTLSVWAAMFAEQALAFGRRAMHSRRWRASDARLRRRRGDRRMSVAWGSSARQRLRLWPLYMALRAADILRSVAGARRRANRRDERAA